MLLYALGYGTEGKNDVGETYSFVLGDKEALPIAATLGVKGMREGGDHPACVAALLEILSVLLAHLTSLRMLIWWTTAASATCAVTWRWRSGITW